MVKFFFGAFAVLAELALWVAVPVAAWDGYWPLAALIACAGVLIVSSRLSCPLEVAFLVLGGGVLLAWHEGAMAVFCLASPRGLGRSLVFAGRIASRAPTVSWESYFARSRRGPRVSALLAFWGRRGTIVRSLGFSIGFALAIAWPTGVYWSAFHWDSSWRVLYEFLAIVVLYLWMCTALVGLGLAPAPVRREVYGGAALPLRGRRVGATASPSAWASDAMLTRVEPPASVQRVDFSSGFAGPLDGRLRLFAADCAEHLLAVARSAGDRRDRRPGRLVRSARARAHGQVPSWRLPILVARARDRRPLQRRIDRRSDAGDDAACAAFHAFVAPTPLNAAQAALNCCSVDARGGLRADEHAWELGRLDWYRDGGQAAD